MRKRLLIILTLCIGLIFVGCGSDKTENDANSNGNTTGTVTDENKDDSTTEKPSTDTSTSPEDQEDAKDKEVSLPIYTADVNTLELTKLGSLKVNESDSLKSKLDKLAIELSKNAFDSLPITVERIDTIKGKKVAIINLEESNENKNVTDYTQFKGANWASSRFQGSTGGSVTTKTLVETFLQRSYEGDWIDGVQFTYKGQPLQFEHAESLNQVTYR